jgi:indole-3-glycerol phosphate synthase
VIAEIKKASPSKGVLRETFDPADDRAELRALGRGMSLGADRHTIFSGRLEDLTLARQACRLPVLRKDFVIDPYQILRRARPEPTVFC